MNNLSRYFKKFTNVVSHDRIIRDRCVQAVSIATGITIARSDIAVQATTIFLTLHPTKKYHILQHRDAILNHINSNTFGFRATAIQ
jgi:hypothetical protein